MAKKGHKTTYTFYEDVFAVVRLIPKGRVTSYGAIANYLGTRMSARMVGWALNAAASEPGVPAHRVVNRAGLLTGRHHFKPPRSMQEMLQKEGVRVARHKVVRFKEHFWDPSAELS